MPSIHNRITLAFTSLAAMMALLAIFAFLDLLFLGDRVHQGVVVANLEYAILEMRREEKNLFLYGDATAGRTAAENATAAAELLQQEQELFRSLAKSGSFGQLQQALASYRSQLLEYEAGGEQAASREEAIRELGQQITQIAGGLIIRERKSLALSISASQWALALSILVLALLVIGVGHALARRVVKPLRRLADDLKPIAEGRFDRLQNRSRDAEMVAFTNAFNRMLDELESRRRRLLQSEKLAALGVLVAGVAHELNNPLSNISSSCQLLLEELDVAERAQLEEWATTIDSETERARQIVSALMVYNQRREAEFDRVPLAELLRTTLLLLKGPLRESGAHIEIDVAEGLLLRADPQRLQQVFINLLRNAIESGAGVRVRVSASPCGEALSTLPNGAEVVGEPNCQLREREQATQILVEDNGCGISAEEIPHVFEPFFTRREPGQGMGLGLYIVQEIIQEHDGCIAISSQAQQGTQIYLRLPCIGDES